MRLIEYVGITIFVFVSGLALGLIIPWPAPALSPVTGSEPTLEPLLAATPTPAATSICDPEIALYARSHIAPLLIEWDDIFPVARRTTRRSLPTEIKKLQEIQRKLAGATITSCTNRIHVYFTEATTEAVNGLEAFLRDEPVDQVEQYFVRAESALREVRMILGEKSQTSASARKQ